MVQIKRKVTIRQKAAQDEAPEETTPVVSQTSTTKPTIKKKQSQESSKTTTAKVKQSQEDTTTTTAKVKQPQESTTSTTSEPTDTEGKKSSKGKALWWIIILLIVIIIIVICATQCGSHSNSDATAPQSETIAADTTATTDNDSIPAAEETAEETADEAADEATDEATDEQEQEQPEATTPAATTTAATTPATTTTSSQPTASTSPATGDVDEMAWRVIRGDYGNGAVRKEKLGNDYNAIQQKVNEKYRNGLVN